MRIVLAGLMGCLITIVCGFAAMSGIGARTPAFAPVTYVSGLPRHQARLGDAEVAQASRLENDNPVAQASRLEKIEPVAQASRLVNDNPATEASRLENNNNPITQSAILENESAMSAPTVTISAKKLPTKKPIAKKPAPEKTNAIVEDHPQGKEPYHAWIKQSTKESAPKTKSQDVVKTIVAADPPKRTDDNDMEDLATAREWRKNLLDKWKNEQADAARNGSEKRDKVSTTVSLEGNEPADKIDKKDPPQKKKKKRHRFLFIRW